jgi:FkbM family methyltransferase
MPAGTRARKLTVPEALLMGAGLVVATWFASAKYHEAQVAHVQYFADAALAELGPIEAKYGPARYSANVEEWIIRDFFQDRRDGTFLDVGANHYQNESNTYYLEKLLGWSGVAVEPLSEFAADYQRHRPKTRFVAAFASDVAGASVDLFVPGSAGKQWASADKSFTERGGEGAEGQAVPTTTLNEVLAQAGLVSIDFLSMDIELSEPAALAGFDIERFRPELVCIEAHPEVRQQLLDYFAAHSYRLIGKYLRIDVSNLYFTPAD